MAELAEYLEIDLTSPSGLRWRKCNDGYGVALKHPGDIAGSVTNAGVWLVSVKGNRYRCLPVLGKLLDLRHSVAMPIEAHSPAVKQQELEHLEYRAGVRV